MKWEELLEMSIGDYVIDDSGDIGMVWNAGRTWLHKHRWVKIKWIYVTIIDNYPMTEKVKYYADSTALKSIKKLRGVRNGKEKSKRSSR